MSLASSHLFTNSHPRPTFYFTTPSLKNPNFSPPNPLLQSLHFPNLCSKPLTFFNFSVKPQTFRLQAYQSDDASPTQGSGGFNLDAFLSIAEVLCILSSAVVAVGYGVSCTFLGSKRAVFRVIGSSKVLAWGLVVLLSGVAFGAWIRKRQWRRSCRVAVKDGRESVDLVERIQKLEEDLKSSTTIIRVLSRQLEKLGIRFRVTRKALKQPIEETAALAQKNSEATRALAMQEDILEKELCEIQKVLLAMQEQQRKQLELILAIGKSGKLWDSSPEPVQEQEMIKKSDLTKGAKQLETHETQASGASKGSNNDRT